MVYEQELKFAKQLARDAGKIMKRYFRSSDIGAQLKNDKTIVTLADTEINSLVINRIKAKFPSHSVHGEEESLVVENSKFTWVCDPVDGTQPFSQGLPISTFSLALVNDSGVSVVGVVYDPFLDKLVEAVKGQGAFINGRPIHVSTKSTLDGAFVDQELWVNEKEGISFDDPKDIFNKAGTKLTVQCSAVIMGCMVADGTYDAMIFGQSKPEDIAALSVIVEEAGGRVTNLLGNNQRYDMQIYGAIVSNGLLHQSLIDIMGTTNYKSKFVTPL
jgi:myo-inositol-1(or 4)-monophosphatase